MEFIGENGVAAPRLKDAGLPPSRMRQAYTGGAGAWRWWGWSAARLADGSSTCILPTPHATFSTPPLTPLDPAHAAEMLVMLRNLYQKCRLVHADLSGEPHAC